jgi:hypothetical protein
MALLKGEFFFFEIDHIGYQIIENFMLISKMQTYLSDKMPPKKLKLKNAKMGLSKIRKLFFNFKFWGGIFSLRKVCFFNSA